MADAPIPLADQVAAVRREVALREAVYANRVRAGRMKPEAAQRELARMRAVLATLEGLVAREVLANQTAVDVHNEAAGRIVGEMWTLTHATARLNLLTESVLLGVGMLNYPRDPRRQAMLIQAIADGAQDRAKAVPG